MRLWSSVHLFPPECGGGGERITKGSELMDTKMNKPHIHKK